MCFFWCITRHVSSVLQGPGVCFRLFTEEAYNTLPNSAEPEIRRCSLASSMLELKCLGLEMDEIGFMDPPDRDSSTADLV